MQQAEVNLYWKTRTSLYHMLYPHWHCGNNVKTPWQTRP